MTNTLRLQTQVKEPKNPADAVIIWLHGLGASSSDFADMPQHLALGEKANIRYILPDAPRLPVTVNGGMVMPAWYDIKAMSVEREIDTPQLEQSAAAVQQLVDEQIAQGIDSRRIIIAGFSQGGAVGYQAALSYPKPLAGLLAHSTYFATQNTVKAHPANAQLPILIQHGTQDPVVPEMLGQQARDALTARGYEVTYQTYPMPHSLCLEQVQDMEQWLLKRFA
ncbi:carboxylesterase [Idiomarina tyrosinivorans]|uniref:Carboxylesterase n=1 Tax=Idiomarina tyrosinivorans TaxID=1445662 RepID=A0A432ZTS6_9GAMM|nr:alpha/beta fold hydrolase [Idiomarina tyrosinivorans]RUO81186.1 carboxylesterase [Idiomarina tyrosinivorans]